MKKMILTAVFMLITAQAYAVQIDKYKLETKAGEPVVLDVSNNEQQPITVKIEIASETTKEVPAGIEDCGAIIPQDPGQAVKIEGNGTTEENANVQRKTRAFPKQFVLQPGENQAVKFMSRQPGWCRVYIVADKKDPDTMQISEGAFVNILMRTGIPLIVTEKK